MPSDSSDIPPATILHRFILVDGFSLAFSFTIDCAGRCAMGFALSD